MVGLKLALLFLCFNFCIGFDFLKLLNDHGSDLKANFGGDECYEDLMEYVNTLAGNGNGTDDQQWALTSKYETYNNN